MLAREGTGPNRTNEESSTGEGHYNDSTIAPTLLNRSRTKNEYYRTTKPRSRCGLAENRPSWGARARLWQSGRLPACLPGRLAWNLDRSNGFVFLLKDESVRVHDALTSDDVPPHRVIPTQRIQRVLRSRERIQGEGEGDQSCMWANVSANQFQRD